MTRSRFLVLIFVLLLMKMFHPLMHCSCPNCQDHCQIEVSNDQLLASAEFQHSADRCLRRHRCKLNVSIVNLKIRAYKSFLFVRINAL